ncbi:MAG: ABC transporter permease, partial [Acidobacteriota bacterium]|nr:ABC transporter permease [Acidobacteriota bacterium]
MSLRRFIQRRHRDAEALSDIQAHLDTETEDNIVRGMSLEEARAAARKKFGNTTLVREEIYRMNTLSLLETVWRDLLYALRTMRQNPVFATTAVLTLALAIGGNTAMFTVIRAVLLNPLQYHDPDQLVRISGGATPTRFTEMRTGARSFADLGAYTGQENLTLSGRNGPEVLKGVHISASFLRILGVDPMRGRGFRPEEDSPGGMPVAMISAELWQRRFAGDPHIVGRTATLDATPYTIIGVLPPRFQFPFPEVDVWMTAPSEWPLFTSASRALSPF